MTKIVETFTAIRIEPIVENCNDYELSAFKEVTPEYVTSIPIKCSSADPAPTEFMKKIFERLIPTVTALINESLNVGHFISHPP